MGIHYNHKSKAGDRKMAKELKRRMKIEARKQKRLAKEQAALDELERLTRPDRSVSKGEDKPISNDEVSS